MTDVMDIRKYVTAHIDEALEKEDIKVYYQPIIRTITGEVCGEEALARWDDPENGLMMPEQFIPILEDYKLIHKLDIYMIKKICAHYSHCVSRKDPLLPISFNLSLVDFELCDIVSILNEETEKAKIPRRMIKIEINERLIAHDREYIKNRLKQFHEEGYEIVIDDFGSGRSSVKILKDYTFDELKIDMGALWGPDEKSKKIIEFLCSMAKSFGIRVVAEGVESEEQSAFLTKIGCGKLQGYYFGKPCVYWDLLPYIREKGLSTESLGLRNYYDIIGQTDIKEKSNLSYGIAEYSNDSIRFLHMNELFKKNIGSVDVQSFDILDSLCNDPESKVRLKFNTLMKLSKERKKEQVMDFVWKGNYCIAKVKHLTGTENRDAFEVIFRNLSMDSMVNHLEKINDALDGVYSIFDRVVILDLDKDKVKVLYNETQFTGKYDGNDYSANKEEYIKKEIYPDDRERYRQFADFKNVEDRIGNSGRNFISGCFRFRNERGNYIWKEQFIILERSHSGERKFLICTKEVDEKQLALLMELSALMSLPEGDPDRSAKGGITGSILWKNSLESIPVGIFWKDKERRFLGVNKAFLEYYGFESEAEVLGRTDEDMNWHVDPIPFKRDEESIINSGKVVNDVVGKCIAKGEIRDILVNKAPIFKDGEIVGLVGYFRDITERTKQYASLNHLSYSDPVTGALNIRGLMDAMVKYEEAYENNNADFAMIAFNIYNYQGMREKFGEEQTNRIMKAVYDRIKQSVGSSAVVGRTGTDIFLIVRQVEKKEEGPTLMQNLSSDMRSIREVEGIPCTVYASAGYAAMSECGSSEALYLAATKRMNDQLERIRRFTAG